MEKGEPKQSELDAFVQAAGVGDTDTVLDFVVRFPLHIRYQEPSHGRSAAMAAALSGDAETLRLLLMAGIANPANEPLRDEHRATALHAAATLQDSTATALLIHYAKEINIRGAGGETPAHAAVDAGAHESLRAIVEDGYFNPNIPDDEGDTVLHRAAKLRDLAALNIILKRREGKERKYTEIDPGVANHKGRTPFTETAALGWLDGAEALLQRYPYLVSQPVGGESGPSTTAVHAAAFCGRRDFLAFLLEKGADPEALDVHGRTPLHSLVMCALPDQPPSGASSLSARFSCIGLLLGASPQPSPADEDGNTPLHCAVFGLAHQLAAGGAPPEGLLEELKKLDREAAVEEVAELMGKAEVEEKLALALATIVVLSGLGWDHSLPNTDGQTLRGVLEAALGYLSEPAQAFAEAFVEACGRRAAPPSRPVSALSRQCEICQPRKPGDVEEREKDMVFVCGHGACGECTERLVGDVMRHRRKCHLCRAPLEPPPRRIV